MSSSPVQAPKRRAQIACKRCRDRKVKCEHENEEPCKRCATSSKECIYEPVSVAQPADTPVLNSSPYTPTSTTFLLEDVHGPPNTYQSQTPPYSSNSVPLHGQQPVLNNQFAYSSYSQPQSSHHANNYPAQNYPMQNTGYGMGVQSSTPAPPQTQSWMQPSQYPGYAYGNTASLNVYQNQNQNQNWQSNGEGYGQGYAMQPQPYNPQRHDESTR